MRKFKSATHSLESYNNFARQEITLNYRNRRKAEHSIVLHHLKDFTKENLCEIWKKLKGYLEKVGIVALKVAEITRDKHKRPRNRIHYHFLVDGDWNEAELRSIFRECCMASGLEEQEFRIDYRKIDKFIGWLCYVLKYNRPEKLILFVPKSGIRKTEAVGPWYLADDGIKISKTRAWENVKTERKKLSEQKAMNSDQLFEEQQFNGEMK